MKKITWICFILLMLATSLLVCSNYSVPSSLSSFVPQKADLLIGVQIDEILNDEDFTHIYEQMAVNNPDMPQTISDALDQIQQEIVVNPRNFYEAQSLLQPFSLEY